jgi:hypothetical protein
MLYMCSRESFCRSPWGERASKADIECDDEGRFGAEFAAHKQSASEPGTRTKRDGA